jgi:hypothetical protein
VMPARRGSPSGGVRAPGWQSRERLWLRMYALLIHDRDAGSIHVWPDTSRRTSLVIGLPLRSCVTADLHRPQ